MITSLYIRNIAVVKELNIDFSSGFSTLTGETGAGKSVIMDCIGILLGSRPIKGKIRHGEREALIRATFETVPEEVQSKLVELGFENKGFVYFESLLRYLNGMAYISTDALLPTGIEIYTTDDSEEVIFESVEK